ncbi:MULTISPECIES: pyrroline-5-carboxylate reductase [unclassified Luteococcus]|uniref:pyrroline-5-carboxylate reductase n=1 Tax=unclassified Luteococcus TaxID=2639923 RepID=UPI00313AD372
MRIALVGVGKMGEAVLSGLARSGTHELVVVNRRTERDDELVDRYGVTAAPLAQAVEGSDVIVVAVKPKDITAMLDEFSPALGGETVVVSLAAGISLASMRQHLPQGTAVARVMPNTPALVGRGMSAISVAEGVTDGQLERVREVMAACGEVVVVPESQQDAVTAVSGSGPAYVFAVAEAMIEAGVQLGLPRDVASTLANQTILGAGAMLVESGTHPSLLRENVTSPGGTTAQALKVLDQHAVRAAFAEAMQASHDRSAELGR